MLIDDRGKINAMELITKFLSEFTKLNLNEIIIDKNYTYSLNDLYYALEFALMSEGTINSTLSYSKNNILKNRLQTIINSKYKSIFEVNEYVTKEDYISKFFH